MNNDISEYSRRSRANQINISEVMDYAKRGYKISHEYFGDTEYIHMVGNRLLTEDMCDFYYELKRREDIGAPWITGWYYIDETECG
jgi:hypothetical protein